MWRSFLSDVSNFKCYNASLGSKEIMKDEETIMMCVSCEGESEGSRRSSGITGGAIITTW